jgi:hypothetical protein
VQFRQRGRDLASRRPELGEGDGAALEVFDGCGCEYGGVGCCDVGTGTR